MQVLATVDVAPHHSAAEEVQRLLATNGVCEDSSCSQTGAVTDGAVTKVVEASQDRSLDQSQLVAVEVTTRSHAAGATAIRETVPFRRAIVAVRQSNILATAFHPELTDDSRWHR